MSYDLIVRVRSMADKRRMLEFMGREYRPYRHILKDFKGDKSRAFISPPEDRKGLSIGIWYSTIMGERDYAHALAKWMALKVGKTRKFPDFEEPLAYVLYDGCEAVAVPVRGEWIGVDTQEHTVVDRFGCRSAWAHERKYSDILKQFEWEMGSIRVEMRRLDKAWSAR